MAETDNASHALQEHERPEMTQAFLAPRDALEQSVADIWSDMLGIKQIGADDDFFELGGQSLMATQMLSRLRDTFQIDLTLQQVFEAPTIAGLALALVQKESKPGQTKKIAELVQKIKTMSPEERQRLRAKPRADKGVS